MSSELEQVILGALMLRPGLLESCELRASDFPPGNLRKAFSTIAAFWEEGRPDEIDPVLLSDQLGGNGDQTFVASLLNGNIKLEPERFRERVTELRKRILISKIETKLLKQTKAGELDLKDIRPEIDEYDRLDAKAFDINNVLVTGAEMQALDIKPEFSIDKLVPSRSLTLLHGPGGLAKTWLVLCLGKAVSGGEPFLGLQTKKRFVIYIDFENPWPMLIDRVRKLDIREIRFWHLSASIRPPKLNSPEWQLYKNLPRDSFIIFDTARSSFDGDENSSQDVSLVMNRLKEIRELGNDIVLLHHTPRANEKASKGSTAWEDLADHVLAFYRVRRDNYEPTDADEELTFDPRALLSLGTGRKTRYEPFKMYLTLDPDNGGFAIAESPNASTIQAIAEYIAGPGFGKNQTDLVAWAKLDLNIRKRDNVLALLKLGEQQGRWHTLTGLRGAKIYEPL